MKKTIILIAYILLLMISSTAYGTAQCMSFGHDPYADDNDYHMLHYVECYCPCSHYKRLPHGQCSYCGHYRYGDELVIMKSDTPQPMHYNTSGKIPTNVVDKKLYKIFGKYKNFNLETQRFTPEAK